MGGRMNGLKLDVIRWRGPESRHAHITSNYRELAAAWLEDNHGDLEDIWNDIYVHFSGFFGSFGPHVFAAAPELLEACRAMIEWDDREKDHAVDFDARMHLCRVAFDKARAAVAKAEGNNGDLESSQQRIEEFGQ